MINREQVAQMAKQIAGVGIMVRLSEADSIIDAGWDNIAIGTVIYKNRLQDATKIYTKTGDSEITTNAGQKVTLNNQQKESMLATYAAIKSVGAKA